MHICISNPSVFHSSSRETNIIAPGQRALINSTSARFSVVSALHECNQTQLGTEKLPVVIACYGNLCNRMLPDTLGPHQPYNGALRAYPYKGTIYGLFIDWLFLKKYHKRNILCILCWSNKVQTLSMMTQWYDNANGIDGLITSEFPQEPVIRGFHVVFVLYLSKL